MKGFESVDVSFCIETRVSYLTLSSNIRTHVEEKGQSIGSYLWVPYDDGENIVKVQTVEEVREEVFDRKVDVNGVENEGVDVIDLVSD